MPESNLVPEHVSAVQHLWYGHGNVPAKSDFENAWKAIKTVAASDGTLSDPERRHLLGKMCAILTPPDVVQLVMDYEAGSETPEQLMERIQVPPEIRPGTGAWIVYEGLSVAMADGELAPAELQAIRATAAAMGVNSQTVQALTALCREERTLRQHRIDLLQSTIPSAFRFAHEASERAAADARMPLPS